MTRAERIRVLLICSMSLLIVGLDITAVNVALPAIGEDLDAGISGLQWSVSAYTVTMAGLLLLAGSMADRFGRRRTLMLGMGVFSFASLLCSLAPTIELLIAARILQGVGAAMLNPVAMSIITNTFTDPRERAQAVGIWGAAFGASMALGPIVGGVLVSAASWEWIFLINVPLGLAAIALLWRHVPESRAPHPRRVDPVGQVLVVVLLASVTFAIIEAPEAGWGSATIVAAFAAAAAALIGLLAYEPRREEPLLELRFFRSVPFSSAVALAIAAMGAFGGFLFLTTLYLQDVRGLSPVEAGIAIVPVALMTVMLSPVSGRMLGRGGPRLPLLIAGVAFTAGAALLVGVDADTPFARLLAVYAVFGVGLGFVNAPITNAAVSGMPVAQAGVAAAIATTSRQFGQALGVAVVGAILASGSTDAAWWTLTGLGALILALGFVATRPQTIGRSSRIRERTLAS